MGKLKERHIFEIINDDQERLNLSNDELIQIWAMGMNEWETVGQLTFGDLKEFAVAKKRRKDMRLIKTSNKFLKLNNLNKNK